MQKWPKWWLGWSHICRGSLWATHHHCCAWMRTAPTCGAWQCGSTAGGQLGWEQHITFCLALADLDFAPPKEAECLLSAGPMRAMFWAGSPPYGTAHELCSPALILGGSSHLCRPLHCLDIMWPTTYMVTCAKAEVLNSPPSLKRCRTCLTSQLGKRCEFCYKRYHFYNRKLL